MAASAVARVPWVPALASAARASFTSTGGLSGNMVTSASVPVATRPITAVATLVIALASEVITLVWMPWKIEEVGMGASGQDESGMVRRVSELAVAAALAI